MAEYFQLAHNFRHPKSGVPTVKVIHSFGRADQLDRQDLVRLCRSIARVAGLAVSDPLEDGGEIPGKKSRLPDDVKMVVTRELGTVHTVESLWEELGIGPLLRKIQKREGCRVPYERALLAMTANRVCEPESKLGVWDRWLEGAYLPSAWGLKLAWMYEAMDLLVAHTGEIEEAVFFKTADLFSLTVDLVFYDATAATLEVDEGDPDSEFGEPGLRQYGANSQGVWQPQIVVALAVTREGLPVRSWVFPGNTSHSTTVATVKRDLRGWKLGRSIFVADSGMNTEENRKELAKGAGKYVLAMRMGTVKEVKENVLLRGGRFTHVSENLRTKEVVVGDGELRRRYVVCWNPKEDRRQKEHRKRVLAELEKELDRHESLDATQKWAIDLLASRRYGRYLEVGRGKKVEIDRKKVKEVEKRDGRWVLLTNDDTLSTRDAADGYKGLLVIERCFRALKRTRVRMTPMYHWLPHRIASHVKICVLALLISRVAEIRAEETWERIRRRLARVQATEFTAQGHRFFQRNEIPAPAAKLMQAIGVKQPKQILDVVAD